MSFHISDRPTKNIPWAVFNAGFPDTFTESQWSIVTGGDLETPSVDIIIFSIPSGNGLIIQDIEYRVDGGTPTSLEVNKSGVYRIFGFEEAQAVNIEIRTVTRKGASDWSDIKGILVLLADLQTLLFSNDEPGVFYDFDDWSTLFQDTAGTQPVTAANQGVALALDKRLGLKLGPELVDLDNLPTPIIANAGGSVGAWSAGSKTFSNTVTGTNDSHPRFAFNLGLTVGLRYKVTGRLSGDLSAISSSGGIRTAVSGTEARVQYDPSTGMFQGYPQSASDVLQFTTDGRQTFNLTIEELSVRELKGNHATQATTAARPLTVIHPDGGVRNLLDRSEEFDNAVWSKVAQGDGSLPVLTYGFPDPEGGNTAWRLQLNAGGNTANDFSLIRQAGLPGITPFRRSIFIKSNTGLDQQVTMVGTRADNVITATTTWERRVTSILGATQFDISAGGNVGTSSVVDVLIWHPQFELGSEPTPYQKRVNFLDVTEAGKRSIRRLYFNGTSHFMTTPVITPNTDKAQVFAGVRKLSDAAVALLIELSPNRNTNDGAFTITAPVTIADNYGIGSKGTVDSFALASGFAAPISNALTFRGDVAAPLTSLRVNGTQAAQSTATQGTGNYLAYPMFIGARNGASLFYNGYIDQLIARFGTNLDTGAIETTEKYVSTKSPEVTL
jgi:hypothetical protein